MSMLSPGDILHDRYVLQRRIGAGGMGEVWQAHDQRLDRPVAIKMIPGSSEDAIRREAHAAARLTHTHIAGIYDFGEERLTGVSYGYLVMELLSGRTLADRLASGPLPWPDAAEIASQIAGALATAHARGIVHRDIKPANIMLTAAGVKVLDFGIAAAAHGGDDTRVLAGTPAYTAPERAHDVNAHPSADVYSLAAVLYEMVTGSVPRPVTSWQDLADADFSRPAPIPTSVPSDVLPILDAALDNDPRRRPTAAAFEAALIGRPARSSVADTTGIATPLTTPTLITPRQVAGVAAVPPPRLAPTTVADPMAAAPGRSPAKVALIAVAVVAIIVVAVIGWAATHTPRGPRAASGANTPTASGPATPSPSSPQSTSTGDVDALLTTLQQTIDSADADGSLDHDQAKTLSRRVQRISQAWAKGDIGDFDDEVQRLRDDLGNGDNHGGGHGQDHGNMDDSVRNAIETIIGELLDAAGGQ